MKKQQVRPVVCVCELNGAVGVVSRQDCDKASRAFWDSIRENETNRSISIFLRPILLKVEPVFTFNANSDQLKRLLSKCFVERGVFWVPTPFIDNMSSTLEASRYLFQERTDWEQMVKEVNALVSRLSQKPWQLKKSVRSSDNPGCILNAYREGDLDFGQAVFVLRVNGKKYAIRKLSKLFRRVIK